MRFALQRLSSRLFRWRRSCNVVVPSQSTVWLDHSRHQSCVASGHRRTIETWQQRRERNSQVEIHKCKTGDPEATAQVQQNRNIGGDGQETPQPIQRVISQKVEQHGKQGSKKAFTSPVSSSDHRIKKQRWRMRLITFEQYQYESDLEASRDDRDLLVNQSSHAGDWNLWMELIRFRKRHYGAQGTRTLFKEIFRRGMLLPTNGAVGNELWELAIMGGYPHSQFLREIVSYAVKLKQTIGERWPQLYYSIVKHALKTDPTLAYDMHIRLKEQLPPSVDDYLKLFQLCVLWDNLDGFEGLYRDFPLQGMYMTVIPELCRLQNFRDAVKWHNLLFTFGDLPSTFAGIHPLLTHLTRAGDSRQVEEIANDLREVCGENSTITGATERFVRKHGEISRETFNRQLGEAHGVAPKHISDSFCARLFATKLFSVDTVINGLQTVGVDTIGPLATREMASRDSCDPKAIQRHLSRLKDVGISPDQSAFSFLLQNLSFRSEHKLIRSLVECDLHPETFEDQDLQERLLAQYYEQDDQLQAERTLAAITIRCREEDVQKWRLNLILRSQITLHRKEAVFSAMQTMTQQNIPITIRSSRHLYVRWLTPRQPGREASSTQELLVIIHAIKSTLRSGRYVPIQAWKAIMLRLGSAGRLQEVEELALWIIDFYTQPLIRNDLPSHKLAWQNQGVGFSAGTHPQAYLNKLFTIPAQHAIVTWGFQHNVKHSSSIGRLGTEYMERARQRPVWMWGLVFLRKLQARGVPVHKSTIARICNLRLAILFGRGVSKSRINRRSVWLKNHHDRALDRWALRFYIRGMEEIWGKDLFQPNMKVSLARKLIEHPKSYVPRYSRLT